MVNEYLFLLHLLSTSWMSGVIWMVQLVHYPSFRFVDSARFTQFESFHCSRISIVVMPAMLIELVTGVTLLFFAPSYIEYWLGAGLLLLLWSSTFLVHMPLHAALAQGYDRVSVDRLILNNWLRTIAWSVRLLIISTVYLRVS